MLVPTDVLTVTGAVEGVHEEAVTKTATAGEMVRFSVGVALMGRGTITFYGTPAEQDMKVEMGVVILMLNRKII
jgi:hypothetical protein